MVKLLYFGSKKKQNKNPLTNSVKNSMGRAQALMEVSTYPKNIRITL